MTIVKYLFLNILHLKCKFGEHLVCLWGYRWIFVPDIIHSVLDEWAFHLDLYSRNISWDVLVGSTPLKNKDML